MRFWETATMHKMSQDKFVKEEALNNAKVQLLNNEFAIEDWKSSDCVNHYLFNDE